MIVEAVIGYSRVFIIVEVIATHTSFGSVFLADLIFVVNSFTFS